MDNYLRLIPRAVAALVLFSSAAYAEDVNGLLPKADAAAGKAKAQICLACHTAEKGAPNKIGPNLWGVEGREIGSVAGYTYSSGMQAMRGQKWTVEHFDTYLTNPAAYVKGNKMAFAGVKNAQERANIIAWLRTLADKPAK
jgi:cytochrome c